MNVLGHPWVKISGIPPPRFACSWTKWMCMPSISARKCANWLSFASALRHEKSYPWVGFPPFFSAHRKSQPSFPVAFVCFFGSRKVWLFVVGRVRFLVKPTFSSWRFTCVTGRTTGAAALLGRIRATAPLSTCITQGVRTHLIRARLGGGARRDRIELPGNVIRVIETDVLAMGRWIFFHPIVAYACRV
jgi:hypothetical protein